MGLAVSSTDFQDIYNLLHKQARAYPHRVAIAALNSPGLSYGQLWELVQGLMGQLQGAGLERQDRVAIALPNGPEMAVVFLASACLTAAAPLNPNYRTTEFEFYLRDLGAKVLIVPAGTDSPAITVAQGLGIRILTLDLGTGDYRLNGVATVAPIVPASEADMALILHTSGTTSRPKIVPLSHRNLCTSAQNIGQTLQLTGGDRCLNIMPLFHIHGLVAALLASLSAGGSVVCTPGFQAPQFLEWLEEFQPTWYTCVPTMHQAILTRSRHLKEIPAPLRLIRSSSAALSPGTIAGLEAVFQVPVIDTYGMTEAAHQITSNPLPPLIRKPGSVGLAAGPAVAIMDEAGNLLPPGSVGEIVIQGGNVTAGYENNPNANASAFTKGWFRTGDQGYFDSDHYLFINDRLKEIINRGGEKVSPREVDEVLLGHPAIAQVVTFAMPHPQLGEEVAAAAVLKPGLATSEPELQDFASQRLAAHKIPRRIVFLSELPKGATGKLQRFGLAEKLGVTAAAPAQTTTFIAPRTPTETALTQIWQEVLGLDQVGVEDNFFDLGGDSLLAAQVINRVRSLLQLELSVLAFWQHPTVAAMAVAMETAQPAQHLISPQNLTEFPLSPAQARIWFLEQLLPGQALHHQTLAIQLPADYGLARLEASLQEICRRHSSLRAIFTGEPLQKIIPPAPYHIPKLTGGTAVELANNFARQPFDLATGPLIRGAIVPGDILVLVAHHLVWDGWSARLLMGELNALYTGYNLPELPIQYGDFVTWQQSQVTAEQFSYWQDQLAGLPPLLELPNDYARKTTWQGSQISAPLPETAALKALSKAARVTLFTTLAAAFGTLLYRYTGREDLVIGCPVAGRSHHETERLIGVFINMVALRFDCGGQPSFQELLQRVQRSIWGALAHSDLPWEQVVEQLQPERNLSYNPIFQVGFNLEPPFPDGELSLATGFDVDTGAAQLDLYLEITETKAGLVAHLRYRTDLFAAETTARMLRHYQNLLRAIATDPGQVIDQLSIIDTAELDQLRRWQQTGQEYAHNQCIHQLFEAQAQANSGAVAVVAGAASLTYGQLNQRADQLANYLQTLGVGPETLVGLCVDRSLDMVVAVLGILKAGGAYVPLDPAYPRDRLAYMLQDAQVNVLLSQSHLSNRLPESAATVIYLDQGDFSGQPQPLTRPDNLAYVIYTSGSTGRPKGVMIQHRSLVNFTQAAIGEYGIQPGDRLLQCSSISFDVAAQEIYSTLCAGATLVLRDDQMLSLAANFLARCRDWQITVLSLATAYWHQLVAALEQEDLPLPPRLRLVVIAGERASPQRVEAWRRRLGTWPKLINAYGPTEATIIVSTCDLSSLTHFYPEVPIGRPIANTNFQILDCHLAPVPIGVAGELHIGGLCLARGYLNRPELTAEKFINTPERLYKTGDLARYLPDGQVQHLGRIDQQVKIRGFRVELGEIERALETHPEVNQAIVSLRADNPDHPQLVAYLVGRAEPGELGSYLGKYLPSYMIPAAFVVIDRFPLTANGKVDRRALPAPTLAPREDFAPPATATEVQLAALWAGVLRVEQIGRHDNFFALGGHSLLVMQLLGRVRSHWAVELTVQNLFTNPTVAELARLIESSVAAPTDLPPLVPREHDGHPPLSFAQERLWFLDQLHPDSGLYNIPLAVHLRGRLDRSALDQSIQEIVNRHAALRTNIIAVNGEPVQVIHSTLRVDINWTDLAGLSAGDREFEAKRLIAEEAGQPFNLAHQPLLRVLLLRLGEEEYILVINIHHIVADGWSLGVFVQELTDLYRAFYRGLPPTLPNLPIQYADFTLWQRHWPEQVWQRQEAYWRQHLAGAPSLLELPTDYPRPAQQAYRGQTCWFELTEDLSMAIADLSRQQGVSVFMTLLAAFQILLYRYTHSDDFCLGVAIANRNHPEIEGLIGFFVNTLVVRADLSGSPNFLELLQRVRRVTLAGYEHQDLPFERLVEVVNPVRSPSYNPLVQVMFVFQNTPKLTWDLPDLQVTQIPVSNNTAKFDLTLAMESMEQRLRGHFEYKSDLFAAGTIERLVGHLKTLLQALVVNPTQQIDRLPLLTATEQEQLRQWSYPQTDYPRNTCIHQLFEAQAAQTPEAIALMWEQGQLTYGQLNHKANQLAWHLRELGIKPEIPVALNLARSPLLIIAILAVLKAGGVYLPLDTNDPRRELILQDAGAGVVLSDYDLAEAINLSAIDLDQYSPENPPSLTGAKNLAYIMYTSGSTGQPKGVCIPHRGVIRLVKGNNYADFDDQAVWLQLAPPAFDAATLEIWASLLNGGRLVLFPGNQPDLEKLGTILQRYQITHLWLTAGLFHLMVDERLEELQHLKQLLAGGDVLSVPHVQRFLQACPNTQLINGYGPTENTTFTCCHRVTGVDSGSIPIGRAIANTQVYILDQHLQPVPIGVSGELYTGGDGLARGYLNRPDLAGFIPNPFYPGESLYKTGDLARYLPDGTIEFLGRTDFQVKIRGFRIELGEVETALTRHPAVQQTAVIAQTDHYGYKQLLAYVVARGEWSKQIEQELRDFLLTKLPDYMIPVMFIHLDVLPLNANGKVDRRALPEPPQPEYQPVFVAPIDAIERKLVQIWQQLLNRPLISTHEDFFGLGGNSLIAARLFLRIQEQFQQTLPLVTLFQNPTIARLAELLRRTTATQWPVLIPLQSQGNKTPLFCIHPGGGNILCYRTLIPHLGDDQPLYALQARGLDGQSQPISNVAEMASNYLAEIRTVQASGPYFLAGYSFGGLVAYEIAQQLHQAGQEVAAVFFWDVISPEILRRGAPALHRKIRIHLDNMVRLHGVTRAKYFTHRIDLKWQKLRSRLRGLVYHLRGQANPEAIADYLIQVEAAHYQAALSYHPSPYPGRVIQFQTIERPTACYHEVGLGWSKFIQNLELIDDLPGHHGTMLDEPYVEALAARLKQYLG